MTQQTRILNPSPKTRFQEVESNIRDHKRMVDLPEFQKGMDYAMLEAQSRWARQVNDGQTAMAVGLKIQGALEFIQELVLLAENQVPVKNEQFGTLQGAVRPN
jgi:hypothetical protein